MRDRGNLDLPRIAAFCEAHFDEWGGRSTIIKRFRTLLWDSAVLNVLRRAALEVDEKEKQRRVAQGRTDLAIREVLKPSIDDAPGITAMLVQQCLASGATRAPVRHADAYADIFVNQGNAPPPPPPAGTSAPSRAAQAHPLLKEIVGTRTHVSTDHLLQYRVVVDPFQLVELTAKGIQGKHPEPGAAGGFDMLGELGIFGSQDSTRTSKKGAPDPHSDLRLWLPASMIRQAQPRLIKDYEDALVAKSKKKPTKKTTPPSIGRAAAPTQTTEDSDDDFPLSQRSRASSRSSWRFPSSSQSRPPSSPPLSSSPSHSTRRPMSEVRLPYISFFLTD